MSAKAANEDDLPDADERARYYLEGAAWADEQLGALRRSRRAAWFLAIAALIVMLLNGAALLSLQPLRRNIVYAVNVEAQRGATLQVRPLQAGVLQDDPVYTQSMLAKYVTAREEFSAFRIVSDYRLVELLSTPAIRGAYTASLGRTSGSSPLVILPPKAVLDVAIASVSLLDTSHALVRYSVTRGDLAGAQPEQAQALVSFRYSRGPMRDLDRYDDPLGFQVTGYSKQLS